MIAKHNRPEDKAVIELLGQARYDRMREIVIALHRHPSKYMLAQFTALVNEMPQEQRAAVRSAVLSAR